VLCVHSARRYATINALVAATTLLVAYWAFRFGVPGVYISGRTREKSAPPPAGMRRAESKNWLRRL
jgi:hypothetical protein